MPRNRGGDAFQGLEEFQPAGPALIQTEKVKVDPSLALTPIPNMTPKFLKGFKSREPILLNPSQRK
jgi:hypothetical protein